MCVSDYAKMHYHNPIAPSASSGGLIRLIMLFVRSTIGHGGPYWVNNAIRTSHHWTR